MPKSISHTQAQPAFAFPTAAYYYPYMYSWQAWPSTEQPTAGPHAPNPNAPMSRATASQQLLDMGLPAFSTLAPPGAPQTTMQSSLTDGPRRSSRAATGGSPRDTSDPYLTRLMQPPRQPWHQPARPPVTMPSTSKILASQHAPGPPTTTGMPSSGPATSSFHNPPMSPRMLREALGGDVYMHFRDVLLKQQETLTHQVCGGVASIADGQDASTAHYIPPRRCGSCIVLCSCSDIWSPLLATLMRCKHKFPPSRATACPVL